MHISAKLNSEVTVSDWCCYGIQISKEKAPILNPISTVFLALLCPKQTNIILHFYSLWRHKVEMESYKVWNINITNTFIEKRPSFGLTCPAFLTPVRRLPQTVHIFAPCRELGGSKNIDHLGGFPRARLRNTDLVNPEITVYEMSPVW